MAYVFRGLTALDFGGVFTSVLHRAQLLPAVPRDACSPIVNEESMRGAIAFIARG